MLINFFKPSSRVHTPLWMGNPLLPPHPPRIQDAVVVPRLSWDIWTWLSPWLGFWETLNKDLPSPYFLKLNPTIRLFIYLILHAQYLYSISKIDLSFWSNNLNFFSVWFTIFIITLILIWACKLFQILITK